MSHRRGLALMLLLVIAGCQAPPPKSTHVSQPVRTRPTAAAIGEAAVAAVAAAPWDHDPTGWGSLCSVEAPCDTLVVEPRVVSLPAQPPAFFVPDSRDEAAKLTDYALSLVRFPGRRTVLGSWGQCSGRRDSPQWRKARVACIALGVAGI